MCLSKATSFQSTMRMLVCSTPGSISVPAVTVTGCALTFLWYITAWESSQRSHAGTHRRDWVTAPLWGTEPRRLWLCQCFHWRVAPAVLSGRLFWKLNHSNHSFFFIRSPCSHSLVFINMQGEMMEGEGGRVLVRHSSGDYWSYQLFEWFSSQPQIAFQAPQMFMSPCCKLTFLISRKVALSEEIVPRDGCRGVH